MAFIKAYIKSKIVCAKYLFHVIKCEWRELKWWAVIPTTLWTMLYIVGGILVEPITLIANAILWKKTPDAQNFINEFLEAFAID